jgi:hypothetical protein
MRRVVSDTRWWVPRVRKVQFLYLGLFLITLSACTHEKSAPKFPPRHTASEPESAAGGTLLALLEEPHTSARDRFTLSDDRLVGVYHHLLEDDQFCLKLATTFVFNSPEGGNHLFVRAIDAAPLP